MKDFLIETSGIILVGILLLSVCVLVLSPVMALGEYMKYRECRIYAEMNDWNHQRAVFGECFVQISKTWVTREEIARGFTSSINIR